MSVWNSVLPVITLVLGYVGTIVTEGRRDRRALAAEDRRRLDERRHEQASRRDTFELETLKQANDALRAFVRAVGRAHHVDTMTAKVTGAYAATQLGEPASDRLFEATVALNGVCGLILDDGIRDKVREALDLGSSLSLNLCGDVDEAEQHFRRAVAAAEAAFDAMNGRIRDLYERR